MCGRYTLTRHEKIAEDLQASLGMSVEQSEWWKPRFNVAPTQPAPVVLLHDGTRTIEMMRWGLVPFWAGREGAKPPLMINARVESLDAKAVFRDALARKRCLVPADGFFEWRRDAAPAKGTGAKKKTAKSKTGKAQPLYFHPKSRKLFAFAGLWARARTDAGEILSFTIVTGPPNELVKPVHDRMPIVLAESVYDAWLDPSLDAQGARALLDVPPTNDWTAEPVSTTVNSAANDDPSCIAPIASDEPRQRSLF
jgi:putative SOS response-associated peptidase YedK